MASKQPVSGLSVLARIFWMMAGPAILFLSAYMTYTTHKGWLSPASITYLVVLAAVVAARSLDPQTADGDPSTATDLQRFAGKTIVGGLVVWAVANYLGAYQ